MSSACHDGTGSAKSHRRTQIREAYLSASGFGEAIKVEQRDMHAKLIMMPFIRCVRAQTVDQNDGNKHCSSMVPERGKMCWLQL